MGTRLLRTYLRGAAMDKKPIFIHVKNTPIDTVYFRNYGCSNYDECLRDAALINHYLDCSRCDYRTQKMLRALEDWEIEGCLNLLGAVFHT
jgi:hypothetical protein